MMHPNDTSAPALPLCRCGCGQTVRFAPRTDRQKGWVKGEALQFRKGHQFAASVRTWESFNNRGKGEKSPSWKGGRRVRFDGYVTRVIDGQSVLEHRYVMEQWLGRPLRPSEIIHHIDEARAHNERANLVIMSRPDHAKHHHSRKPKGDYCVVPR